MERTLLVLIFLLLKIQFSFGQSYTAVSSGPWTNGGNWDNGVPTCGGPIAITIPDGFSIRINDSDIDLSGCTVTLLVESGGTLRLTNGNMAVTTSITMGSGSTIEIENGGFLETRDGGGAGDNANNSITIGTFEVWNGAGDNDFDGDDVIYEEGTIVPIELIFLEAVQNESGIIVNWSTASELDNDYFTVERSKDGIQFDQIAKVKGAGTRMQLSEYSFVDRDPLEGVSYYRLRQTDFDGSTESFEIKRVYFQSSSSNLITYPNPTSDFVFVEKQSDSEVEIFDDQGRKMTNFYAEESGHRVKISFRSLEKGVYFICYGSVNEKIVKQ